MKISENAKFEQVSVALMKLQNAIRECSNMFNEVDEGKLNEYICEDYPFEKDFQTMASEIMNWTQNSRIRIYQSLHPEMCKTERRTT